MAVIILRSRTAPGTRSLGEIYSSMTDDPLDHMRSRIEQCRRLARMITDPEAVKMLRQMADEGEADLKRLEAERADR